jgi:hypothetical protein
MGRLLALRVVVVCCVCIALASAPFLSSVRSLQGPERLLAELELELKNLGKVNAARLEKSK